MEEQKILEIKKNLLTSTEAAALFGVTNDYITQLCRKRKVSGTLEGRVWMVEEGSVKKYLDEVRSKIEVRRKDLSEKLRTVHEPQAIPALPVPAAAAQVQKREGWGRGALALGVSALVIVALVGGNMVASADHAQSASVASAVKGFVAKVFGLSTETPFVETKTAPVAAVPVQQISNTTNNTYQNTYNNTYNTYPSIAAKESVSQNEFTTKLNELRKDIANIHSGGEGPVLSYAPAFRIDKLDNVTLSNAVVHSLSGLADSDIPDTITVANYLPLSGGTVDNLTITGTCTGCGTGSSDTNWSFFNNSGIKLATTTNQVLIGASATSTTAKLEVVGGASFDQATTTSFFTTTSSSTNSFTTNAFITNATTTTFFATVASSTSLFATSATSSAFAITNVGATLLKTLSSGAVVAAVAGTDYVTPATDSVGSWFTPGASSFGTAANSTSTLILFTAGISASSTSRFAGISTISATTTVFSSVSSSTIGGFLNAVNGGYVSLTGATTSAFAVTGSTTISSVLNVAGQLNANSVLGVASTTPWARFSVDTSNLTTGQPSFAVGSSSRTDFVITQAGNVGVGTTSPYAPLSVSTSGFLASVLSSSNTAATYLSMINTSSGGHDWWLGTTGSSNGWGVGKFAIYDNTAAANRFLIDTAGNTGISSTTPWARFSVDTSSLAAGVPSFAVGSSSRTDFVVTQSGNVGVGTTSPRTTFHTVSSDTSVGGNLLENTSMVFSNGFSVLQLQRDTNTLNTGVGTGFSLYDSASTTQEYGYIGALIESATASAEKGSLIFDTTSSGSARQERMRITAAGNVGIGSTTPWGLLSVNASGLAAGVPQFVVGSSTRTDFVVTQAGNVGIGTTTLYSGDKLSIYGGNLFLANTASPQIVLKDGAQANSNLGFRTTAGSAYIGRFNDNGTLSSFIQTFNLSNGNVGIGSTSPWGLLSVNASGLAAGVPQFVVGSSTRTNFVVTQAGRVLIGTSTALDPNRYSFYANDLQINGTSTNSRAVGLTFVNSGTDTDLRYLSMVYRNQVLSFNAAADATAPGASSGFDGPFQIDMANSRVATTYDLNIGAINSTYPFYVEKGASAWAGLILNTFSNATVYFAHGSGYGMHINPSSNASASTYGLQVLDNTAATALYVRGDGKVGIGTSGPLFQFMAQDSVAGSYVGEFYNADTSATSRGIRIRAGSSAGNPGTTNYFILFANGGGTTKGYISGDGAGGVNYTSSSDRRLKENIATTTAGLDTLMKVSVRDFDFISDPEHRKLQGFIAQELNDVYPLAVSSNGDNGTDPLASTSMPWSVDYGRVTPLIVKAIQDLNFKVEDMATTTASSSLPQGSFTAHFFNALFVRITTWLADAGNGVGSIFAKTFHAKEEICIDDQCLTRDDVRALLILTHGGGQASGGGSPQPPPAPPGAPEEASSTSPTTEGPDTEATSTPPAPQIPEEEPAPAQESASASESAPQTSPEAPVVSQTTEESQ